MDPAALGTALIGQEWVRREQSMEPVRRRRNRGRQVVAGSVRHLFALILRRTAELLEPAPAR